MRVIAGRLRGARLDAPDGENTRPITDRVKEALFSSLGHRFGTLAKLPPLEVLDLFAGSGSLGIESLSRGARGCLFVERDRGALRVLRENLSRLKLIDAARVSTENAWTMRFAERAGGYGLVFVDPPYRDAEDALRVADLLDRIGPHVAMDGFVVFRHDARHPVALDRARWLQVEDERRFRKMELVLLRRREAQTSPGQ